MHRPGLIRRTRQTVAPEQALAIVLTPPVIDWAQDPDPGRQIFVAKLPRAEGQPCLSMELIRGSGPHGALTVIREVLAICGDYWLYEEESRRLRKCGHTLIDMWFLVSLCLHGENDRARRDVTRQYINDLLAAQVT